MTVPAGHRTRCSGTPDLYQRFASPRKGALGSFDKRPGIQSAEDLQSLVQVIAAAKCAISRLQQA